jgi:hypothetical protein
MPATSSKSRSWEIDVKCVKGATHVNSLKSPAAITAAERSWARISAMKA